MMYHVYLLENARDKSWYIGYTTNIKQRLADHKDGKGGKTTKAKSGWRLVYLESYRNKYDATGRERFLKSGSGRRFLKKQLTHYLQDGVN